MKLVKIIIILQPNLCLLPKYFRIFMKKKKKKDTEYDYEILFQWCLNNYTRVVRDINKFPEHVIVCNCYITKFYKIQNSRLITKLAIICCIKVICAYKKPTYVFTWQLYVFL